MARNLVDNALRYNHAGGRITVEAGTAAGEAFLRVANTGPRVAAEAADGLFVPFVRGDDDRARAERGAGLGLALVRAVATAHGGAVTAKARPAGGLDITVRLPSGDGGPVDGAARTTAQASVACSASANSSGRHM
jgi:signal transduction histidine kinase